MDPTWGEEFEEMLPEIESAIKLLNKLTSLTIDKQLS